MKKDFSTLWRDIEERGRRFSIPIVQDYAELEYIFNLIKDCASYLEIGTAEANGLYILAHALKEDAYIVSVDYGEKHTKPARDEVLKQFNVEAIHGNSHERTVIRRADGIYDVVFIDAGHSYEDVIADAMVYGKMARKFIVFHDVQMPEVKKAFEWYVAQNDMISHYFINSDNYGYGIVTL